MKKNLIKKNSKWIGTFLFLSFAVSIFFFGQINVTKASILNAILDSAQNQTSQNNTQTNTTSSGSGSILNAILNSAQEQTRNAIDGCNNCNTSTVVTPSTPKITTPTPPPPAPTPIPTLSASCSVNPSAVNIGGTLNWRANASGGTGSYTYSWSGTDGLTSTFSSVFKSYSTAGTKTGTVTITSGSQSITRTCSAVVNTPTPTLSASCSVNPSAVNIGGTLSWGVNASGGTGSYTYSWSGTDGLTSNSPFVSKSYSTAGTKTGTVTITSGSQSITQTCSAVVNQNIVVNDLTVSCSVNPSYVEVYDDVNWRANASGGTGSYTYSWSGTNSLSGSNRNIVWSYNTSGTKRGTVTVTSGGQSASASCTVIVEEENINDDLTVSCYANPTNVQVGSQMNWYAQVRGGNGDYRYSWTGTDGLNSSSRSPAMTYYTVGNKTATVVVRDGDGQRVSRTCNIYVGQNTVLAFSQVNQPPLAQAVYLNQVPYTGVADNYKTAIFMGILALISAWIAYAVIAYKKNNQINFN